MRANTTSVNLGQEWRFSASEPRAACGWFGSLHSAPVARSGAVRSHQSAVSFGLAASGTGHAGLSVVSQFTVASRRHHRSARVFRSNTPTQTAPRGNTPPPCAFPGQYPDARARVLGQYRQHTCSSSSRFGRNAISSLAECAGLPGHYPAAHARALAPWAGDEWLAAFLSRPSAISFGLAASGTGHAGTQFVQQFHSRFSVASQVCAGLPEQYSDADRFPGQYPAAVRLSGAIPRRKGTSAGAIPPAHMLVLLAVWWQYHQFSCRMCGSSGAMPR